MEFSIIRFILAWHCAQKWPGAILICAGLKTMAWHLPHRPPCSLTVSLFFTLFASKKRNPHATLLAVAKGVRIC